MKPKSWVLVLIALLVMTSINTASAGYFINGTTYRSDTGGVLGSVYIFNGTNYTTSDATTGVFSISSMDNNTNGWTFTAQFNATGSYLPNTTTIIVNGANVSGVNMNLTVRVPAISSLASSSVGKTSATVSWTSNISNVGNKLTYSTDSNLANNLFTTDWSNSTTSPSFALTNLRVNTKYYYRASTANIVNSSATYTTTSDSSFTTGHGYVEEELPIEAIAKGVVTPKPTAKPAIDLSAITGKKGTGISKQGVVMLIAFIAVAGIVAFVWQANKSTGKPRKRRRNN